MNSLAAEFVSLTEYILQQGKGIRFLAKGKSMYPFIREEDTITVEPIEEGRLRLGDVIFYRSNEGRIIIHRVIKKVFYGDSMMIVTKGDASLVLDTAIPLEHVLGRVKLIQRGKKTIALDKKRIRCRDILYVMFFLFCGRCKAVARTLFPFILKNRIKTFSSKF
jgi:signal peptidase I